LLKFQQIRQCLQRTVLSQSRLHRIWMLIQLKVEAWKLLVLFEFAYIIVRFTYHGWP
jgi:hypothetical protein